jgi:multidrug efflux pump subunit AcrA (membrane-fusion protein)
MNTTCEFCNHTFATVGNRNRHYPKCSDKQLQTQKHHYETQLQKQQEHYETQLQKQQEHYETQLQKQQTQLQKQQEHYETQLQKQQTQLQKQREYIQDQQDRIVRLENQIFEIAKQPKNITTNNNTTQTNNSRNTAIINQLAPYDLTKEHITQLFYQHFNLDTFHGGPEEIVKLTAQVILTNPETHKPKVACTDISRKNFRYVDEEQEVQIDPGFQKTHDLIKGPLSKANIRVYTDELNAADQYRDQWRKNEDFIANRSGFSDKLVKWMV